MIEVSSRNYFNDLVFAFRNKAYGAFELRRVYDRYMSWAMILATLVILMGIFLMYTRRDKDDFDIAYQVTLPPQSEIPEMPSILMVKKQTTAKEESAPIEEETPKPIDEIPTKVVEEEPIPEKKDEKKEQLEAKPIEKKDENPTSGQTNAQQIKEGSASGTNTGTASNSVKTSNTRPYFPPGGDPDLQKFLKENINYPLEARKNKIKGKVIVAFIVEKSGEITRPRIRSGLGYGCDEEVLRVLALMPKWIPGNINGNVIKLEVTMTIEFNP
jgi:periplasmic protein TonB